MAQVPLTPVHVVSASVVETLAAANTGTYPSGGNTFANTPGTWLEVQNDDAGSHTMTVSWTRDGVVVTRTQPVAAGVRRKFAFSPTEYGATINIHFEAVTDVFVGAYYV